MPLALGAVFRTALPFPFPEPVLGATPRRAEAEPLADEGLLPVAGDPDPALGEAVAGALEGVPEGLPPPAGAGVGAGEPPPPGEGDGDEVGGMPTEGIPSVGPVQANAKPAVTNATLKIVRPE